MKPCSKMGFDQNFLESEIWFDVIGIYMYNDFIIYPSSLRNRLAHYNAQ